VGGSKQVAATISVVVPPEADSADLIFLWNFRHGYSGAFDSVQSGWGYQITRQAGVGQVFEIEIGGRSANGPVGMILNNDFPSGSDVDLNVAPGSYVYTLYWWGYRADTDMTLTGRGTLNALARWS
jgi:hypothetical protein